MWGSEQFTVRRSPFAVGALGGVEDPRKLESEHSQMGLMRLMRLMGHSKP
jgi:hypothetical protein